MGGEQGSATATLPPARGSPGRQRVPLKSTVSPPGQPHIIPKKGTGKNKRNSSVSAKRSSSGGSSSTAPVTSSPSDRLHRQNPASTSTAATATTKGTARVAKVANKAKMPQRSSTQSLASTMGVTTKPSAPAVASAAADIAVAARPSGASTPPPLPSTGRNVPTHASLSNTAAGATAPPRRRSRTLSHEKKRDSTEKKTSSSDVSSEQRSSVVQLPPLTRGASKPRAVSEPSSGGLAVPGSATTVGSGSSGGVAVGGVASRDQLCSRSSKTLSISQTSLGEGQRQPSRTASLAPIGCTGHPAAGGSRPSLSPPLPPPLSFEHAATTPTTAATTAAATTATGARGSLAGVGSNTVGGSSAPRRSLQLSSPAPLQPLAGRLGSLSSKSFLGGSGVVRAVESEASPSASNTLPVAVLPGDETAAAATTAVGGVQRSSSARAGVSHVVAETPITAAAAAAAVVTDATRESKEGAGSGNDKTDEQVEEDENEKEKDNGDEAVDAASQSSSSAVAAAAKMDSEEEDDEDADVDSSSASCEEEEDDDEEGVDDDTEEDDEEEDDSDDDSEDSESDSDSESESSSDSDDEREAEAARRRRRKARLRKARAAASHAPSKGSVAGKTNGASKTGSTEPQRIPTKISREGDANVKVVYAVRTRRCFNKYVKEIMTRFGFEKATDFDMYCIDATGDRVDIDIEEDFDNLLDTFAATMAAAAAAAEEAPTHGKGNSKRLPRSGPPGKPQWSVSGTTRSSSSNPSAPPRHGVPSPPSLAATGNTMDDDGKSSSSVLRLYVRYSNAYYMAHGYPEQPRSQSANASAATAAAASLYLSPNAPNRLLGPSMASLFSNQLQQLSTLPSVPGGENVMQSTDQMAGLYHAGAAAAPEGSPFSPTLLASTVGSVTGNSNGGGVLPRQGSRGASGGIPAHAFNVSVGSSGNGGPGAAWGNGASVLRSSLFSGPGGDPPSPDTVSQGCLTETQRSVFTNTFTVDESALVEWRRMSVLGKGSFGTVYEGITLDGKMIAVKVQELPEDDDAAEIKALQMEINLMRSLKHRNIVAYYGCQTRATANGGEQMEIFLELCHGGSLASLRRKLVKTQQSFGISLVRSYTRQVLEGLAYLHAQHVIHRDIKSDNVLISATGEAKLADFGCSKRFGGNTAPGVNGGGGGAPPPAPAAMYQTMVGSPFFMAPEVMREDEGGYTSAADIWSVGCLLIELLGREPWDITGTNVFQIMFRIAREQGMPTGVPRNCPAMLLSFFERCFERTPSKRATAAELLEHEWLTCPDKALEEVPDVTDVHSPA